VRSLYWMTNALVWRGGKLATEQQGQGKNSTRGVSTEDTREQAGQRGASAENVRTLCSMYKTLFAADKVR
jgi:hypothetical protein